MTDGLCNYGQRAIVEGISRAILGGIDGRRQSVPVAVGRLVRVRLGDGVGILHKLCGGTPIFRWCDMIACRE